MSEDLNKEVENVNEGEELDNIIILNDEDGNEVEFEFLDLIEYEGEEYVVLLPVEEEETEEPGEVVILKLEDTESEDEESYVSVEDEEVLNKVFEKFKEKFEDEFNFVDYKYLETFPLPEGHVSISLKGERIYEKFI